MPKSFPLSAAYLAQGLALLGAIGLATFAPQPGRASALVPVHLGASHASARMAARWVASEDARWLAFDRETGQATVIAPKASSLARALLYGFLPIASDIPNCTTPRMAKHLNETSHDTN